MNANAVAVPYDVVDAAYIFDGLRIQRVIKREQDRDFTLEGAGELEDYGSMFERSIQAAVAISGLVDPEEFERLAVFCYEQLEPDSPLIKSLFERHNDRPEEVVRDWCKDHGIKMKL